VRTTLRRRPSAALVVAVMALIVALAGTSYAVTSLSKNSVGAKQIKRGAVRTSELAKDAVKTKKVKDGSLLKADFASGQLPTQGITTVTTRKVTQSLGPTGAFAGVDLTASCQAGERAVGGGGLINNDDNEVTFQASHPSPDSNGSTPDGWTVRFQITGVAHNVTTYAVCAGS
jgi:hypothetical protein